MLLNCSVGGLLRVPWTASTSNQSILKEISPEYLLEGLMLKLKLPYYGHLMWRANSLEKTLMLGKMEGRRRRGQQRMRWLDGITNSVDMSLSELWEFFSYQSVLCIRWPKYWSFGFIINPSNKYSGLISFKMDWLDFLAVQRTLKSLLQHHSSKVSILQGSAFFIVQLSHPYICM